MKSWKELLSGEDPACSIDQKPRILRLRVFAGPNGAGKSTICNAVGAMEVDGRPIDMGYHVNTDEISKQLKHGEVDLASFQLQDFGIGMIYQIARYSKLVGTGFSEKAFQNLIVVSGTKIKLLVPRYRYQIALILAEFLRRRLIAEEKKLTFETVLAHPSKLDLILHAAAKGYLIYLYFIGTESPEINKYRVKSRVKQGGHFVPEYKVESRYFKSMDLLHEAAQISYRVYFIDNSAHGQANMFAHFKVIDEKKIWDPVDWEKVPQWFYRYYVDKVKLQVASR